MVEANARTKMARSWFPPLQAIGTFRCVASFPNIRVVEMLWLAKACCLRKTLHYERLEASEMAEGLTHGPRLQTFLAVA